MKIYELDYVNSGCIPSEARLENVMTKQRKVDKLYDW